MPEPVTIHLSNVWVNEKVKEPKHSNKPRGKLCILWKGENDKLNKLAQLLSEYEYIENPPVLLAHFSQDPLKRTEASPIKWEKTKYELQYLLRNLNNCEFRESHSIHFEDLKPPPWSGNKPTEKLDTIKAILKQVN